MYLRYFPKYARFPLTLCFKFTMCNLSLVLESQGYSPDAEHGLLLLRLLGSRARAQQLWPMGLAASQHVDSSQIKDQTHIPCIGRRILNH